MTLNEFQEKSFSTAIYPDKGDNFVYPTLGIVGEAGEIAEKIKKVIRDRNGVVSMQDKLEIAKEIGDVLWYCAVLAYELDFTLSEVAQMNVDKIQDRINRRVQSGSGDNR